MLAQPAAIRRLLPMPYEIADVLWPAMGEAVALPDNRVRNTMGKPQKKVNGGESHDLQL